MKVIFLDVDGVLNNEETFIKNEEYFLKSGYFIPDIDETMVKRLKRIVMETDAKIVLSSSWRTGWDQDYRKCSMHVKELIKILGKYGLVITDKTPYRGSGCRQEEIKEWLNKHSEVKQFVILDDETSFLMDFAGTHLIKTNKLPYGVMLTDISDSTGIEEIHVKEAIRILNKKEENYDK